MTAAEAKLVQPGDEFTINFAAFVPPMNSPYKYKTAANKIVLIHDGDIIVAQDPPYPTDAPMELLRSQFPVDWAGDPYSQLLIPIGVLTPLKSARLTSVAAKCKCNIMVTGCICGVFAAEQLTKEHADGT